MATLSWAVFSTFSRRKLIPAVLAAGLLAIAGLPARAQSVAQFYEGKTITIVIAGSSIGGGYDIRSRLLSRHLGKHIPGNPRFIVQHVPGTISGANHVYNNAAKDGTAISLPQRTLFTAPYLAPEGVQFELTKFNWIGNLESDVGVIVGGPQTLAFTADDLFTKEIIVGGSSPFTMPAVLNALIGTKFKLVVGYSGVDDRFLATERGELMGPGEASWGNVKAGKANELRDKKIKLLIQNGLKKAPDLPDVPLSRDYAKGDNRILLDQFLSQRDIGYPVFMPPGVPADRVAAIRAAFLALGNDAEFKEDAKRTKVEFNLMSGADVEEVVKGLASMPEPLVLRLRELAGPGGVN